MAEETKLIGQLSIGIEKLKSDILLAEQELKKLDKYRNMTLTVKFDGSTTKMFTSLAAQLDKIIGSFSKLNAAMKMTDTQAQQTSKNINRVLVGVSNLGTPYKVIENRNAKGRVTSTQQTFVDQTTGYQNQVLTNAQGGILSQSKVTQDAAKRIQTDINRIITAYNLLDVSQRRNKVNVQAAIAALTALSQRENIFVGDLKRVLAAKIQMENADKRLTAETLRLANAQAKFDIAKVMNQYKSLSIEEQKRSVNINSTISAINALMVKYANEASIISVLIARKNQLTLAEQRSNVARTSTSVGAFANSKFTQLLHQYNTELITTEQYMRKLTMFKTTRFFGYLTNSNQTRLLTEYNRALKETARLQREADYKPLNSALANYKMLSTEEQKRVGNIRVLIAEYDKLIAKYRVEGKAVTQLVADRNKLDESIRRNIANATTEYQNILRQNGLVRNSMLSTAGVAGQQRRYGVMDKIANSLIYTTSGMLYGQSIMAVRNAVQTNKEYETSLNSLSRTLGQVTEKDLRFYGEEAKRLAKEFGVPIKSVMDALVELARAGYDTEEQLIPMTKTVLLGLNTTEITNAADMVSYLVSAVKQLGLEEMNTTEIVDKWNFLADKYAVTTDDFAEATKKAGSASKLLGIDLDTLNALVVVLGEQTQATGAELGTALKTLETRLLRPDTVKTMEDLGIVVKEDADHFKTFQQIMSQVATKLDEFGEGSIKSVELLDSLGGAWRRNQITILGQNWGDIEGIKSRSAIEAIGWSMQENEKVMTTYAKAIELLKVAFSELALALGQAGLFAQLKALTEGLKGAVNWFNQLPPMIQRSIVVFFELNLLLVVLKNTFTAVFGMQALNMLLLYVAQVRGLSAGFLGFKLSLQSISAAQTMVNQVAATQLITESERLLINQALTNQQIVQIHNQKAMTLQQQAFTFAVTQSRAAAIGFNIAMSVGILAILAVIGLAIAGMQNAKAEMERAEETFRDSSRVFAETQKELASLKQEYMNLLPVLNDTKEAKNSLISVEERLNNLYDAGTEKLNLQRNALTKNLTIFREAEEAKARAYTTGSGVLGEEAGRKLKESATMSYTGLGKSERLSWLTDLLSESDLLKKSTLKLPESEGMGKFTLDITGTMRERYDALDTVLAEVHLRMSQLNKDLPDQKDEFNQLSSIVKRITPDYNKLKTELADLEDQFNKYTAGPMDVLSRSDTGKKFEKMFKTPIDAVQKGMEALTTGMSAGDMKAATDKFNQQFSDMRDSLFSKTQTGEISADESVAMTTMMNDVQATVVNALNNMGGAAEETKNIFADLTESIAAFEQATTTLASALSEVNENQGMSVQSALKLLDLHPELANAMRVEGNLIKINGDALRAVWEVEKQKHITDLEHSKESAVAAYDSLKLKLGYYLDEGNALKDLSAIKQMEMKQTIDKRKDQLDEINKGLGGMSPDFAVQQADVIERDEAYLEALDYDEKIDAINKRLKMLKMPLDAWIPPDEGDGKDLGDYTDYLGDSALLAKDRYYKLNLELQKTNTLLAKNKALQENATEKERIVLMREEIVLLKRKQENIHNIAEENRRERADVMVALGSGFKYEGYGDELTISNAKEMLDMKKDELNNINPKLNAVNKQLYEDMKDEVETLEKNLARFFELQLKLIPGAQQEWMGLEKDIKEVGKAISDLYLASYQKLAAGLRSTEEMIKSAIVDRDNLRKEALQDELDGIESAEEAAWEAYQKDVDNKRKQYEDRYQIIIDGLEKEKNALRKAYDESKEKKEDEKLQEELAMLQAKYVNMARENSGRFEKEKVEAQKKITELQEKIAERAADKLVESEEEKLDLQIENYQKKQEKELEDFNKSVELEEDKYKTKDDFLKGDWSNFNKYSNMRKLEIKRELDDLDSTSKLYWERINRETLALMKTGEENIIAFLKMNSSEYYNAGEFKAKEMLRGWNAALEDAKLSKGIDTDLIKTLQEKFIKAQQEGDLAGMIQAATAANDERTSHGLAPENVEYIADLYKERDAKVEGIMPGVTSPIPGVTGDLEYQGLYEDYTPIKAGDTKKPTVTEKELTKAIRYNELLDQEKQRYRDAEAEGDLAAMIKAAINADDYRLLLGGDIQNIQNVRELIQQRRDKIAANPDLKQFETIAGYTNNQKYKDRYGFALGGINTQKGLYALHGTPQSSEVIFNSGQAKKLFEFVNSLSTIANPLNNIISSMVNGSDTPSNFNIESIVVNVEKLDSDVDYDELAAKVGDSIYKKTGFTTFSVSRR